MSTYYLIPIGGSGARVMRAFIYMCAAGCFNGEHQFKVKIVDSDESNGDLDDMIKAWDLYDNMQQLCKDIKMPEVVTVTSSSVSKKRWSPIENTSHNLKEMLSYSEMNEAKELVDFIFTEDELLNVYEGGFYGHTSVGSYFMKDKIVKEDGSFSDEWAKFFEGHKEGDKVFIFGSFFGGTGASGVPTISRIIHDNKTEETNNMKIGAEFIMPYFITSEIDRNGENMLKIDWSTFSAKTKTALGFYENQHYDEIFSSFYCIGEDPDYFMVVPNEVQGEKQANKPNHIEMLAATALLDFMNSDNDEFNFNLLGAPKNIDSNAINGIFKANDDSSTNIATRMEDFFIMSVIYTKYIYYCIEDEKACDWKYNKKVFDKATNRIIYDLCKRYIRWIRKMSVSTDEFGKINYRSKAKRFKFINIDEKYDYLYNGKAIEYHIDGIGMFRHKKYDLEQLEELSGILCGRKLNSIKSIITDDFGSKKNDSWCNLIKNLLESIK